MTSEPIITRAALSTQARVIGALVLRELVIRFGKSRYAYVWLFLRPIFLIVLITTFFTVSDRFTPQGMPIVVFVTTGYLTWFTFLSTLSGLSTFDPASGGVLSFPQVTHLDVFAARGVVDWATYTTVFVLLTGASLLLGQGSLPDNPFGVVFGFWTAWWLGLVLGIIAACIYRYTDVLENILSPLRRLGLFISGVLFVAAALPSWVLPWLSWNPIFHCMEIIRESWWPAYRSPIADSGYVMTLCFFLTAFALLLERVTRRREPE